MAMNGEWLLNTPVGEHLCHAVDCHVPVSPALLMCKRHWRMVPRGMQNQVWKHYRKGQEDTKDPSRDYLRVAMKAIRYVAELEGRLKSS